MSVLTLTTDVSLFLTDYASYNNGSQFEFGHWVDLSNFNNAIEFKEYVAEHFKKCDLKSPLDSPREEMMITDYDGLPDCLYSEAMSNEDLDKIFKYLEFASKLESADVEDWINLHNNACDNDSCGLSHLNRIYVMDEDFWTSFFSDTESAIRATFYGDFNYSHDYCVFNGSGNIDSFSNSRIMDEIDEEAIIMDIIDNPEVYDSLSMIW